MVAPLSGVRLTNKTEITISNIDEVTSAMLANFTADVAVKTLKREQRARTFPHKKGDYLTIVDRRHGVSEYDVRPGGRIMYQNNTQTMSEVLNWIAHKLVVVSPVGIKKGGQTPAWRNIPYQDAHAFVVNGKFVANIDDQTTIMSFERGFNYDKHIGKDSQFQFVNTMVYARRIENGIGIKEALIGGSKNRPAGKRGRHSTVRWSMQAPSGVYRAVAKAAKLRWGQTVRINYVEAQLTLGATIYSGTKHSFKQFYPTIVVRPRSTTKGLT